MTSIQSLRWFRSKYGKRNGNLIIEAVKVSILLTGFAGLIAYYYS
jgi:hypothetical protein